MDSIKLKVKGMMCEGCENRLKNSLKSLKGVKNVEASYKEENVTISGNSIDKEEIISKIKDLDFEVM